MEKGGSWNGIKAQWQSCGRKPSGGPLTHVPLQEALPLPRAVAEPRAVSRNGKSQRSHEECVSQHCRLPGRLTLQCQGTGAPWQPEEHPARTEGSHVWRWRECCPRLAPGPPPGKGPPSLHGGLFSAITGLHFSWHLLCSLSMKCLLMSHLSVLEGIIPLCNPVVWNVELPAGIMSTVS